MARASSSRRGFGRIEKRESGHYRAAYTGPDGRLYRAPVTFDARDDAVAWLAARRAEIQMEVWAPEAAARGASRASAPTLRAYGDDWLETRRARGRELRPTTRQQYRMLLDTHIYPAFGDERIDRITAQAVNELPDRYKLMALLAAWCAMRFGELAELRRKDIDLQNNRVKITRGVVRVEGKFIVGPPKSDAGVRDVAIPPHLLPVVKAHLKDHTRPGKESLLFPAAEGESHIAPSTLYKVYYPARKAADRKDLRWHNLRHTGATLAAQTGATLAELMGRLGHSTPGAAMRYQHAAADRDTEIAKRLSALVSAPDVKVEK